MEGAFPDHLRTGARVTAGLRAGLLARSPYQFFWGTAPSFPRARPSTQPGGSRRTHSQYCSAPLPAEPAGFLTFFAPVVQERSEQPKREVKQPLHGALSWLALAFR